MIYKYFRKMSCLGADHKKMIMISRIIHSFSVVNHQTFGQFLTKADPVMIQLQSLNKYFAQNNQLADSPLQKIITSIMRKQTLNDIGDKIEIEDPSNRKFNIFEVFAYCLFKEMQREMKDVKLSADIEKQIYEEKRKTYFLYFQKIIDALKEVELKRFEIQQILPSLKSHILDCQIQFAKKQIYRRLYQMCHYSEKNILKEPNFSKENIILEIFIKKIDFEYTQCAQLFVNEFSQKQQTYICDDLISKVVNQNQFHPFITSQISALFVNQLNEGYYSPLLTLLDRFKSVSGLKQKKDGNQQRYAQTFSFIPTFITKIFIDKMQIMTKNVYIGGQKQLGKSSNLLLLILLRGYTNLPKYILFPSFTIEKIKNSAYMCIVQTCWKQLSKSEFIQIEQICKQLMKGQIIQNEQQSSNLSFYQKHFSNLLVVLQSKIKGFLLDQFSIFIQKINSQKIKQNTQQKLLINFFDKIRSMSEINIIGCSFDVSKLKQVSKKLKILKSEIQLLNEDQGFQGQMGNQLFVVWLKMCYKELLYGNKLELESLKIKNTKQKNTQKNNIKKIKQFEIKNQKILQNKQNIQNVKVKIDEIIKIINKNPKKHYHSGQMSNIKRQAKRMIAQFLENPKIQINQQLINQIKIRQKLQFYKKLIIDWVTVEFQDQDQLYLRKHMIMALLMGQSIQKLKFLYIRHKNVKFPTFLFKQNTNQLKQEIQEIMRQLWAEVRQACQLSDLDQKNLFGALEQMYRGSY